MKTRSLYIENLAEMEVEDICSIRKGGLMSDVANDEETLPSAMVLGGQKEDEPQSLPCEDRSSNVQWGYEPVWSSGKFLRRF